MKRIKARDEQRTSGVSFDVEREQVASFGQFGMRFSSHGPTELQGNSNPRPLAVCTCSPERCREENMCTDAPDSRAASASSTYLRRSATC